MLESFYFYKEISVGQLFGFYQRVPEPHPTRTCRSDEAVKILKTNTIRLECSRSSASYVGNKPNNTFIRLVVMFHQAIK